MYVKMVPATSLSHSLKSTTKPTLLRFRLLEPGLLLSTGERMIFKATISKVSLEDFWLRFEPVVSPHSLYALKLRPVFLSSIFHS